MGRTSVVVGALLFIVAAGIFAADSAAPVCNCKPMAVTVTHVGANATDAIAIVNYTYKSPSLTISVGDTVTWTNNDTVPHTATSDKPLFDTGLLATGQSGSFTFTTAGTFPYHCTIHPYMTAAIVVMPAGGGGGGLSGTWTGTLKGKPFSQIGASAKTLSESITLTFVQTGAALTASVVVSGGSAVDTVGQTGNENLWLIGGDGVTNYALSGHLDKTGTTISGTGIIFDANGDQEVSFKVKSAPKKAVKKQP